MVRYSNGGLETQMQKACQFFKMSDVFKVRQVTWPDTYTDRYSDESCIQVVGIQMITLPNFS